MEIIIRKLFNAEGIETGANLTSRVNYKTNSSQKQAEEEKLKTFAFENLYPREELGIYSNINIDLPSITVIRKFNELPYEEINADIQ